VALIFERLAARLHLLVWSQPGALTDPAFDLMAQLLLPGVLGGAVVATVPADARRSAGTAVITMLGAVAVPALLVSPSVMAGSPPATLERLRVVVLPLHPSDPVIPGRIVEDCVAVWPASSECGLLAAPADLPVAELPGGELRLVATLDSARNWPEAIDAFRYTWVLSVDGPADVVAAGPELPDGLPPLPRVKLKLDAGANVGTWVSRCLAVRRRYPRAVCVR
jgi:hypothetical protein